MIDPRTADELRNLHRGVQELRTAIARLPVREGKVRGGGTINIVHGQAVGAVSGGTFDIDQIELINGSMPSGVDEATSDTIEVENPFGFTIDDNGLARAEQGDDGTWYATQAVCPA